MRAQMQNQSFNLGCWKSKMFSSSHLLDAYVHFLGLQPKEGASTHQDLANLCCPDTCGRHVGTS